LESTLHEVEKLKTGSPAINFVNRYRHKDGSYRWLSWVSAPYGDVLYASATDITELKHVEKSLLHSKAELQRSNRELEQFAYVSSHDLQEPLRKVKNYADLLAKKYQPELDETAFKYLNIITSGAARMQKLIDDLLSVSRVTTRGNQLERIDMQLVVNDVLDIYDLRFQEEDVAFTSSDMPVVNADKGQLTQLLQNLISNSLKFRSKEPPSLHFSVSETNESWLFEFQDNGIGFDTKFADRIFVVFQRLHARDEYSGTGIGLAICQKIVERHGGEIWADSDPGKGSTFYFTLPK